MAVVLAPEAGDFAGLAVAGTIIIGALVALGMVTVMRAFTNAVVGGIGKLIGGIPLVGHVLSSPVNDVLHWMNHAFGEAELALDGALAFWLHQLGALIAFLGQEIHATGRLMWMLANTLLGSNFARAVWHYLHRLEARVGQVEHAAAADLQRLERFTVGLPARIEAAVVPMLRPLEHAIDVTIPHDLLGIRARTREILDRLEALWQRVRRLDALLGTAAFAAAVAVALPRLGLGWLRCRNWGRLGRSVCGLPYELLDALLVGAIDAFAVTDLCELAHLMTLTTEAFEPLLLDFVDVEEALVDCHGSTAPPPLGLPALHLPPVTADLLAAA